METKISNSSVCQININDVVVSDVTRKIYDYSNRENEITTLVESIGTIGQREPIIVIKKDKKYLVLDGVLRLEALNRLNSDEIDAIVIEFDLTDEFSLSDLIIHHQIRKQLKTNREKSNEVIGLLRIDSENSNPLRDKEERVKLVSSLLGGKGWGRNNVFTLENILRWERKNGTALNLSEKVISNEISVNKAQETIRLIENPSFDREKEKECKVIEGFLQGNYNAAKAVELIKVYDRKRNEKPTVINLYPEDKGNFTIIPGNIEDIELPEDLLIDTVFTSPPYYKLVHYGDDPNELGWEKTPEEYVQRLCNILMKCYDRLKDTGSMFVNLGETYEDGQCLGVTDMLVLELRRRGVRFVDRIIWNKGSSSKPNRNNIKRLNNGYETILHFSKSKDYYFERFKIKSDKTLKVSKGCKEKGSNKVGYHIPNNYKQFRSVLSENEVSNIISVQINRNRTKHTEGEEVHPAVFSNNLPVVPLLISTPKNRDSVVMDPFMGSGSCGVTALQLGFRFVGVELYEKNIKTAERVMSEAQESFDESSLNSMFDDFGVSGNSDMNLEDIQEVA